MNNGRGIGREGEGVLLIVMTGRDWVRRAREGREWARQGGEGILGRDGIAKGDGWAGSRASGCCLPKAREEKSPFLDTLPAVTLRNWFTSWGSALITGS